MAMIIVILGCGYSYCLILINFPYFVALEAPKGRRSETFIGTVAPTTLLETDANINIRGDWSIWIELGIYGASVKIKKIKIMDTLAKAGICNRNLLVTPPKEQTLPRIEQTNEVSHISDFPKTDKRK